MKVLVTGGAGFIASHVADIYLANGLEVVVVDDLSTGRRSNLNPQAKFFEMDIRDPRMEEIFAAERPDFVNHHAAQMDVRRSMVQPIFDADVNILGSINLIENARKYNVKRFVYISTGGAVYGEPDYLPVDEEHPIRPICQYGASKHTVEHYLFMYYVNHGLNYTVLRYPNVYGPRQNPMGEAGVIAIFTGQMLSGKPIVINGDGEQQRDFVYVGDCARANLMAIQNENSNGIFNIGFNRGTTVNQIFDGLRKITGYDQEPTYGPAKVGETRFIYLSAQKAEQVLGWKPSVELEEGLEKTVEYLRESEVVLK